MVRVKKNKLTIGNIVSALGVIAIAVFVVYVIVSYYKKKKADDNSAATPSDAVKLQPRLSGSLYSSSSPGKVGSFQAVKNSADTTVTLSNASVYSPTPGIASSGDFQLIF